MREGGRIDGYVGLMNNQINKYLLFYFFFASKTYSFMKTNLKEDKTMLQFLDWEAIGNPIIWILMAINVMIIVVSFIINRKEN